MSTPLPSSRWLVAGATGLIGRALVAELAQQGHSLCLLTRRPLPTGLAPDGAEVLLRPNLCAPGPLPPLTHACIALGTTMAQAGSQQAFRAVDLEAVLAVATAARAAGATRLAVVSALGADPRSGVFYNRVKGEMENGVAALGFTHLVLARPSLLDGPRNSLGQAERPGEAWALRLTRPLAPLIPARWRPIAAARVARAMLRALQADAATGIRVIESAELARLGA